MAVSARVMVAAPRRATGLRILQGVLHFSYPLSIASHDIPDMSDAVEFDLQLVDLGHDLVEAADLDVSVVDEVASAVVH